MILLQNHLELLSGSNDAYAKNQTYLAADLETVKSYLMTAKTQLCIWLV